MLVPLGRAVSKHFVKVEPLLAKAELSTYDIMCKNGGGAVKYEQYRHKEKQNV